MLNIRSTCLNSITENNKNKKSFQVFPFLHNLFYKWKKGAKQIKSQIKNSYSSKWKHIQSSYHPECCMSIIIPCSLHSIYQGRWLMLLLCLGLGFSQLMTLSVLNWKPKKTRMDGHLTPGLPPSQQCHWCSSSPSTNAVRTCSPNMRPQHLFLSIITFKSQKLLYRKNIYNPFFRIWEPQL